MKKQKRCPACKRRGGSLIHVYGDGPKRCMSCWIEWLMATDRFDRRAPTRCNSST